MAEVLRRWFSAEPKPSLLVPGMYHYQAPADAPRPYRLHLRVEADGAGVLLVNATSVLHLNPTAAAHALLMIRNLPERDAAREIASRYRVSRRRALEDHRLLREQIEAVAVTPDLDPVVFLGMDREEPLRDKPSAPYRLDLALTYRLGAGEATDPLARRRVDRELSTDEWKRILRLAWDASVPHVTFTGGEPTVRDDLTELVAEAESLGLVAGLLTDGRRFAGGNLLERLSQAGLDHLLIALDPHDATSLDGLRQAIASDVYTAAHLTLTPESEATDETLKQLKEMGLAGVSLSASLTTDALAEALHRARDLAANLGLDLIWDLPVPYSATHPIQLEVEAAQPGAGRAYLYVEPDGDVLPGQGIDRVLGNLLRDDWPSIWGAA